MKAYKNDGDIDEFFMDKSEVVAEGLRDKGSERSFEENIVVGEHADDGNDEEDCKQGQRCKPSQRVVSYVGRIFSKEGFETGEQGFRVGQEGLETGGLRA